MQIAHINFTDTRVGIGSSVRAIMDAQKLRGDCPTLYVSQQSTLDEGVFSISNTNGAWEQSMHAFESQEGLTGLAAGAVLDLWRHPGFVAADIVHLHATSASYFSYGLLPTLAAKPLVWSIYEAQPYTAGCSHTFICQEWQKTNCSTCRLVSPEKQNRSAELFLLKKAIYGITPFAAVTVNSWLTSQIRNSILAERFAAEIPIAINPVFFRRTIKQEVRQKLNIPSDAFVIACMLPTGMNHPLYGGQTILKLLTNWRNYNQNVVILQLGVEEQADVIPEPFVRRILPYDLPVEQRSAALQAADVYLHLTPFDAAGANLLEAMAAGIPPLAVSTAAGTQVRHLETGYLVSSDSTDELVRAILFLRGRPDFSRRLGNAAAEQIKNCCRPDVIAEAYSAVYQRLQRLGGREWSKEENQQIMPQLPSEGASIPAMWEQLELEKRVKAAVNQGIDGLWRELASCKQGYSPDRKREAGAFVDLFMGFVLSKAVQPLSPALVFDVIDQWMLHRKLPQLCGDFTVLEKQALQLFTKLIRQSLVNFFVSTPPDIFAQMSPFQQSRMIGFWHTLFFNDCSTPYLEDEEHLDVRRQVEATVGLKRLYPDLLIRTMFTPFPPEAVKLDMKNLLKRDVPLVIQAILAFWIVNIPYTDGDAKRQRIMRRNVRAFLKSAMENPEQMDRNIFFSVLSHFVVQFWRAAYLGSNLVEEISLFGDFLHMQMKRMYPQFMEQIQPKPREEGRRIRIGYVSTNFCFQAVSFYMANRIFFTNRQKFEIVVFSLEKRHDALTDRIKSFSDQFIVLSKVDVADLYRVAETIKQSNLDVLVFADIGMEPITYQLGAMRLAPTQCVLVGHGATTGLPTMDYYLSGDFEAPEAQQHYREKLIRLPNLGAAQMIPPFPPTGRRKRKDFGLPEDKVILVSCANGIKHGPERDHVLVEILQRAPRAVIILKPFMAPEMAQPKWVRRINEAAHKGKVADRLLIVPPLEHPTDLMDFLSLADIQLDTFPYGGWTTNMEAVYAGLAIVTQEGEQGRSRWGAHILRALGITTGIAANEQEYIQQAVALVNNDELREQIRQQIKALAVDVLFNGAAAQPAYEAELLRIYGCQVNQTQQVVQ